MIKSLVVSCVALAALVVHDTMAVHPIAQRAPRTESEIADRQRFLRYRQRLLAACSNSDAGRELREQSNHLIAAKLEELRASRRRLDAVTVLTTTHKTNLTDVSVNTYPEYLFGDDDSVKCVLAPETTQTSFYVKGELYRQDITEDQAGVSLSTELQFIDVNTCTPVSDLWIDLWHANAAGVYSVLWALQLGKARTRRMLIPPSCGGSFRRIRTGWRASRASFRVTTRAALHTLTLLPPTAARIRTTTRTLEAQQSMQGNSSSTKI
ncbi:hypothetical protein PF010_g27527 [Phytophthora fragariae]|uniref:Intradiol ring-cleavage dioxygenases domain-containing protein n=1 Tax=Phytophthora fragariae TaxID=53985 RepID=A0A6G0MLT4_9STRA|nr:hypothetical protein PF010_g27527 [Phytophthora fragariae]KAE9173326.1 hypothetical protein PF004_g27006 [Phytophthora fragariae]